ncbi:phage late control D family protein [Escherichia coli]|uniref:Phage late control D family protein n=1 Tax=Escherichia coli TaxID=562 RepID=A0A376X792_ECOLX|nr:phage late control D family protein [Escherichia coli]
MAEINSTAQVTSALTGVSDVLTPVFTLWYLQKNITSDIAPYVTRVTWSDNIKNESDTIEVELDDTDGRWLDKWYPGKGDTLTLKMGYQDEKLLSCGYVLYRRDRSEFARFRCFYPWGGHLG